MKKTIALFFVLICFAVQSVSAQVPGYRGKRFSAGYNASGFFYFANLNFEDGAIGVFGQTRLSYKTELYANYAISRKASMGFSYYTAKQKDYFKQQYVENYDYVVPATEFVRCKLNIYELHFQFFKKNFVAPVGLYNQFGIGLVQYNLAEDSMQLTTNNYYGNGYNATYTIKKPLETLSCFKLSWHVGKINPIGNHLYINTAFGVNLFTGGDYINMLNTQRRTTSTSYLPDNFSRAMRAHNMLEIKIGLGWLAF